jgi:hypothetical protein
MQSMGEEVLLQAIGSFPVGLATNGLALRFQKVGRLAPDQHGGRPLRAHLPASVTSLPTTAIYPESPRSGRINVPAGRTVGAPRPSVHG